MMEPRMQEYFKLAQFIASNYSKDDSTKVGAILLSKDTSIELTRGYNGMPRGCDDTNPARLVRPEKYEWFEHAERNAIFNYASQFLQNSIAVVNYPLTMSCARALVQSGVRAVFGTNSHFSEKVRELFQETAVFVEGDDPTSHALMSILAVSVPNWERRVGRYKAEADFRSSLTNEESCILLSATNWAVLSVGHSGSVRWVPDNEPLDFYREHACRNAIYAKAKAMGLDGCVAVVTFMPCVDCARGLLQIGCSRIITEQPDLAHDRWGAHFEKSLELLARTGVSLQFTEGDLPC